MAFSNLWSSERLSFSLSVVAVISAAVTSYFQFFDHSTEISCVVHSDIRFPVGHGISRSDTFAFECTFLNSGSTPVGLIESRMFLSSSADSTFNLQDSPFGDQVGRHTVQTSQRSWNQTAYFPEKSVVTIPFVTEIDSADLSRLIIESPPMIDYPEETLLRAGIWLRMVDPYGKESTTILEISNPSFNRKSLHLSTWGIPWGEKFKMSPFQIREDV